MPKLKYGKTMESRLLGRSKVYPKPLYHLGLRQDRWKAERRRLIITLREMRQLLVAHRRGPGKPLMGRRFSYTIPYILDCMKRDGRYLPPYRDIAALAVRCQDLGWPDHYLALELAAEWINSKQGGKPVPRKHRPPPQLSPHGFIPDDMDSGEEEVLMQDPARRANHAMIAHIRLNRDREEVALSAPGGEFDREELRADLKDLRDVLELLQAEMAELHGVSVRTLSRMENLERKGTYLPHASTLRKLADLCWERGWPERAAVLEKAAGWGRRHKFASRKPIRGD